MAVNQVEEFRVQIENLGKDFVCKTTLPATLASVSFLGPFQGETILWDMTLATLSYFRSTQDGNISVARSGLFNSPFIEIAEGKEGVVKIQVGLDLELIDEPVIKKAIIMIRNYKRLGIGRIGFGSMHT